MADNTETNLASAPALTPWQALQWLAAMGADEAIADKPADWQNFAPQPAAKPAPQKPIAATPTEQPSPAFKKPAPAPLAAPTPMPAMQTTVTATTLAELRAELEAFDACALKKTAMNLVFADGNPSSGIMIIGDTPAADEDRQGIPFVGKSGQLLTDMLAAINLKARNDYYITNILPWRPPGNRTPTDMEMAQCLPFLLRHIELVNPKVLLGLGGVATKLITNQTAGITRLRGKWLDIEIGEEKIPFLPTLNPADLLRSPAQKRLAWQDMLTFKNFINRSSN